LALNAFGGSLDVIICGKWFHYFSLTLGVLQLRPLSPKNASGLKGKNQLEARKARENHRGVYWMTEDKGESLGLAPQFPTPYYAVIFANERSGVDSEAYGRTADAMLKMAAAQDGYLGVETVGDAEGNAITVSYWRDEASIQAWGQQGAHQAAQKAGKDKWYSAFRLRIAKVERDRAWP
jgi:heme-degrading monooxygenase HmoA